MVMQIKHLVLLLLLPSDPEGAVESVRINEVSVLSGLNLE